LEIKQFTGINLNLLRSMLMLATVFVVMCQFRGTASLLGQVVGLLDRSTAWFLVPLVPLVLLPLAMTMALLWKTKEVILDSVFGAKP